VRATDTRVTKADGGVYPTSPLLQELRQLYPSLPPAERRIADVIFARPREVVNLTTVELAKQAGASQPGASRLCGRLSTKSFSAFKVRLAQEVGASTSTDDLVASAPSEQGSAHRHDPRLAEIVEQTRDDMAIGLRAVATLDPDALDTAAETVLAAKSIVICGFDLSGAVAWRLASLLHRSGLRARPERDPYHAPWVADLRQGDVLMIISYRGKVPQLMSAVRRAREQGVTVLLLTNEARSEMAAEADAVLLTVAPAATSDDDYTSGPAVYVQLATARALWLAVRRELPRSTRRR
jgi:DNA-binding MurR/RpiR family transcriptional regulator